MKIELRRVEYSERMSQKTSAFTADLYVDGRKAGTVSNTGRGFITSFEPQDPRGWELIQKANAWCKELPPGVYRDGSEERTYVMTLEDYVDDLLDEYLKQRFRRELERSFRQHIVFGADPDESYGSVKLVNPVEALCSDENGRMLLTSCLAEINSRFMQEGERILNSNIPGAILKAAGLQERQYVKPAIAEAKPRTPKRRSGKWKSKRI
ncbi:hypothetical protein JHJ32_07705 [Parapedobacter sp. ISTM3]|uniref:hypothetical protein n=1 Tax=Parapedobacter sp. ISTM3 TaxID=2800130 RepID=UPI0019030375|nr:hypothetical protein [Parapedobacter sp. ISTM3]MBK1439863.1 hypothetical protein [Parapedobacter sp. ISTM3]